MTDSFPVLYILMRSDLDSMNPGKGMAQASHASNLFVGHVKSYRNDKSTLNLFKEWEENGLAAAIEQWERRKEFLAKHGIPMDWKKPTKENGGQFFGTTLVLAVNELQMNTAAAVAISMGYVAGVVHDSTYPLRDGDCCHFLPLDTCAYIFGDKNDPLLGAVVGNFPLHP